MKQKTFLPILLMHGVTADNNTMADLKRYIQESAPGTIVVSVPCEDKLGSVITSMPDQLLDFTRKVKQIKMEYGIDEHHLICHSQGGLLCRAYIQMTQNHGVKVFISLTGGM